MLSSKHLRGVLARTISYANVFLKTILSLGCKKLVTEVQLYLYLNTRDLFPRRESLKLSHVLSHTVGNWESGLRLLDFYHDLSRFDPAMEDI